MNTHRVSKNAALALLGRESRNGAYGPHPFLTAVLAAVGDGLSPSGQAITARALRGERLLGAERAHALALARHHAPAYAGLIVARVA